MKNSYAFTCILAALFSATPLLTKAQEGTDSVRCLNRSDLLQMIHLPVSDLNNTELIDLMDEKGYQQGTDIVQEYDTIDGIALGYRGHVYYDIEDGHLEPTVYIFESRDGLSNVIRLNLRRDSECTLLLSNSFHEGGYMYDGRRGVYTGRDGVGKHHGVYEAEFREIGTRVLLTVRFESERIAHAKQEKGRKTEKISGVLQRTDRLMEYNLYHRAYALLDSVTGLYGPLDTELKAKRAIVRAAHMDYAYNRMKSAINEEHDVAAGLAWCDTLMTLTPDNDTVMRMRQVLQGQYEGFSQSYATLQPGPYAEVLAELDRVVNREIRMYPMDKKQVLKMHFSFNTTHENNSRAMADLDVNLGFLASKAKVKQRVTDLQRQFDSIAALPVIAPVFLNGINVNTEHSLSAEVEWLYGEVKVNSRNEKANPEVYRYVNSIVDRYFTDQTAVAVGKKGVRMPYRRDYKFGITRKRYLDSTYTDVSLVDFKTSGVLSWMPSLILPGTGTKSQGAINNAAARAIPFLLMAGLSATGFVLMGQNFDRTPWSDGGFEFWKHEGLDKILAFGCGGIAATIYTVDLVQSIRATVVNRKRSKQLRQDLKKNGKIDIRMEDIHLR